jgi:RNA polymerase sigma factor (TIGR02999 family)
MNIQAPEEVTQLLLDWRDGDASALEQLLPLVYDELRRLARQCLRRERAGHTMQTTTLVHEAYLRLIDARRVAWHDRAHFFAIAAQLMRRVLVDEARRRHFQKRGGKLIRLSLTEAMPISPERDAELVALDEALDRLAALAPRKCRVVELRFFGGLSIEQTAAALNVSTDIVKREWRTAKLWLLHELSSAERASDGPCTVGAH